MSASALPLILVVDDVEDSRDIYSEYLQAFGWKVVLAVNGREGVDLARKHRPDVIVMDVSLPVLDGWEATRILKSDPSTKGAVVIAMTALPEQQSKERCFQAGADYFLTKPCMPEELTDLIASALRR
jgi:CheY-like chemotaxis protein